ncbi:MAG: HAMP domain-containing protein, partial [Clostridia bacterium]|nr:HAMP domain-containing protein [Clostridia bacterium]
EFYKDDMDSDAIRSRIVENLPILRNGLESTDENSEDESLGYISFTNYYLLFTQYGDFFYDPAAEPAVTSFMQSDWYKQFEKGTQIFAHLPLIQASTDDGVDILCVVHSFYVGDILCYGVNIVPFADIQRQFSDLLAFGYDDYILYCNNQILYSNRGGDSEIDISAYPSEMFSGRQYESITYSEGDNTHIMALCTYVNEDYRVAVCVSKASMLLPYQEVFSDFRLLMCAIVLMLLIAFVIALKGILNRLGRLEREMNRVREGNYQVKLNDRHNDEIGRLANTFNMMLGKIEEDRQRDEKMQYLLMVSAIDPHYLYNTLNTVTALAALGRNQDVITVNTALIATLKDRMKLKNYKTFDTVANEMEAMRQYMTIQGYLCAQRIDYKFIASKEDMNLLIPKNVIQPLVENAIRHGILCKENADEPGKIRVSVIKSEHNMHINVEDNGKGIDRDTLQAYFSAANGKDLPSTASDQHIGVANIKTRLNYLYRGNYQCIATSEIGCGTKIDIIIPMTSYTES